MGNFYRDTLYSTELQADSKLIQVSKCLDLIENSEYKLQLIELLQFNSISKEYIPINGARKIVTSIIQRDELFKKIDIDSHISNVKYLPSDDENTVNIQIDNIENYSSTSLIAETIYSSKKDYFDCFYKLERFANFCIAEGHLNLLKENIEYLNTEYKGKEGFEKSFRLLLDKDGKYFVRAITSTNRYFDYNIRFSLFVTILALHKLKKENKIGFKIQYCEYDESFIRIFFEKEGATTIPNIGTMTFMLEMSNDEIKREAFKFTSLITITASSENEDLNIYLKPRKLQTEFISIKHSYTPETVIERVSKLNEFIRLAEEEMKNDIIDFSKVENADNLRYILLRKIEFSREAKLSENNNALKNELKETLSQKIYKIHELLVLMDKVDKIVTDLELKEYLRYIFYDVLTKKK